MSLANKLITVTGAASGIGLSTARLLARQGALLSLADINTKNLSTAHEELVSLHPSQNPKSAIFSTTVDITSTSAVNSWLDRTVKHFGRPIDGAANVAGFHPLWTPKNIQDISDEQFEQVMNINTLGVFKCLRAQLSPSIFNTAGGSIVNIGSVSGLIGFAGDSAYVASKHAVHGITKCAAKEVGSRGIRVNAVAPGQTDTPMVRKMEKEGGGVLPTPNVTLGREGKPKEVAELVGWLLGEGSSYVTGCVYRVDGGMVD